ncbi:MAG: hypothetical protein V1800_12145 [Candidatus Latescibacterota bacterium]
MDPCGGLMIAVVEDLEHASIWPMEVGSRPIVHSSDGTELPPSSGHPSEKADGSLFRLQDATS